MLHYQVDDQVFEFDDTEVKQVLDGMPLTDYRVIDYLTNTIQNGINNINENVIKQGVNYAHN